MLTRAFVHRVYQFLILVLALSFMSSPSSGQTTAREDTSSNYLPPAGSWALQFRITANFTLADFQGGTISLKRHLSPTRALRIGISSSASLSKTEDESVRSDTTYFVDNRSRNGQGLSVTAYYLTYHPAVTGVSLYHGLGPTISFSHTAETRRQEGRLGVDELGTSSSSWTAGLASVVGVEWFATKSMSFSAEYSLQFIYTYTHSIVFNENDDGTSDGRDESGNTFSLGSGSVRFGLSVYF